MTACRPTGGKTNYNSSLLQADAEGKRQPAGTLQPLGTVSYGLRLAGLVLQVPAGAGPKAGWRLPPESLSFRNHKRSKGQKPALMKLRLLQATAEPREPPCRSELCIFFLGK